MEKQKIKVGYVEGDRDHSELAARHMLGACIEPEFVPYSRNFDLFRAVEHRHIARAVMPIESSMTGTFMEVYEHLWRFDLTRIVGEFTWKVSHNLIGSQEALLQGIKRVYAHPTTLHECRHSLKGREKQLIEIPSYSVDRDLRRIIDDGITNDAVIATDVTAKVCGGKLLYRNMGENQNHRIRFCLISNFCANGEPGKTKISLALASNEGSHGLADIALVFAEYGLQLTKLEMRELIGKACDTIYFVDFLGHVDDLDVQHAMNDLRACAELSMFGCYPVQIE